MQLNCHSTVMLENDTVWDAFEPLMVKNGAEKKFKMYMPQFPGNLTPY